MKKRIVWMFGDGRTAYTLVDPAQRAGAESEAEQIERLKALVAPILKPANPRVDGTIRTPAEYDAYLAELGDGAVPKFVAVIDETEYQAKFTSARDFREAWAWTTKDPVIDIDMKRAAEVHRGRLRIARAPLLAALDVAYNRADEKNDTAEKKRIAAQKQALRDVTADAIIDAATSLGELRKAIPAALVKG